MLLQMERSPIAGSGLGDLFELGGGVWCIIAIDEVGIVYFAMDTRDGITVPFPSNKRVQRLEVVMAAFKSRAQAERCKKLVGEGKMSQADYDRYVAESGGAEGIAKLPERAAK